MASKKGLSVTQLKMYENMVEADFSALMDIVNRYRAALKDQARVEVSKKTGLYELKKIEKTLELQLDEVRTKIRTIAGGRHSWNNTDFDKAVSREIDELLAGIGGGALADIEAAHEHFIRKVRLAGLTDEVRDLFENQLPNKIKELSATVKLLPEPQMANEDDKKLLED